MNNVQILGRLTADPELRKSQSGISSCKFTVAITRRFKNKQGEYEADFVTCIAWKEKAEFISRYWSKGKLIALDGELRSGSYTDKNHSDVTHYTTDIMVNNVYFCGDKADNQGSTQPSAPPTNYGNLSDYEEILIGEPPF